LITGAAYSLLLMQRSFQGEPDETRQLVDFGTREMLTMAVMMTALIVLGIYPQPILDISRPVVESLISFSSIVTGGSL